MLCIERDQGGHDRLPRIGALRNDTVAADVARESIAETANRRYLLPVECRVRGYCSAIEDSGVSTNSGAHQIDTHVRQFVRRDLRPGVDENLEPDTEAGGIEVLVRAWGGTAPQVEVEDALQLRWGCKGHELGAVLESAVLNDLVHELRLQLWYDPRELRQVEQAIDQVSPSSGLQGVRMAPTGRTGGFGHDPP